jgi:hypothetical protein
MERWRQIPRHVKAAFLDSWDADLHYQMMEQGVNEFEWAHGEESNTYTVYSPDGHELFIRAYTREEWHARAPAERTLHYVIHVD